MVYGYYHTDKIVGIAMASRAFFDFNDRLNQKAIHASIGQN